MHITVKVVATDSTVTALSVAIAVTLVVLVCTSLSQHCHYHCCPSTVTGRYCWRCNITISAIVVTTQCSFSLPQRCARFRCHNAVHIVAQPQWDSSCVASSFMYRYKNNLKRTWDLNFRPKLSGLFKKDL